MWAPSGGRRGLLDHVTSWCTNICWHENTNLLIRVLAVLCVFSNMVYHGRLVKRKNYLYVYSCELLPVLRSKTCYFLLQNMSVLKGKSFPMNSYSTKFILLNTLYSCKYVSWHTSSRTWVIYFVVIFCKLATVFIFLRCRLCLASDVESVVISMKRNKDVKLGYHFHQHDYHGWSHFPIISIYSTDIIFMCLECVFTDTHTHSGSVLIRSL